LVYDVRHQGWSVDSYLAGAGLSIHYAVEQQEGDLVSGTATYQVLVGGDTAGVIYNFVAGAIDGATPISCIVSTKESTEGDVRAQKLFGDYFLDFLNPTASGATNFTANAMSLGTAYQTTVFTQSNTRQQLPVDLPSGGIYAFALGVFLTWSVPAAMATPVVVYTWQPSYVSKPETTAMRAQDWDDAGTKGAKFFQGYLLEANTFGNTKQLGIRNGDTNVLQQVFPIVHNRQSEIAYSFVSPFIAHMVRYEPQDAVDWDFFSVKWIFQKTPEQVTTWITQLSSLGWEGFGHVYAINAAYASQAPVTFTMTFDGTSQIYTLPSTSGVMTKIFLNLQANKGKLYSFAWQSTAGFSDLRIDEEAFVCQVGGWSRNDAYRAWVSVGGPQGVVATI
jgi:hypothetical protein